MVEPTLTVGKPQTPQDAQRPRADLFSGGNKVTAGRFEIDLSRPLSDFEHDYAEAFECSSQETGLNDHVAIVIRERSPVRKDAIHVCLNNEITGLIVLRVAMTVDWPGEQKQRYVIIYRRPGGRAVLSKHTPRREPLTEELLRRGIIRPIFFALRDLSDRGIFHGNVRPDNIFLTTHENAEALLGECISSIPGIVQPIIYETIERSMADPEGKGTGVIADDIYSFGASIAIMCRGHNPLEGKSKDDIIEDKINRGSYGVFTDGLRLSPGISEFLRATLSDDPKQRWGIEHLASWVDGNRTTPKPSNVAHKAQRAMDFNGEKYVRPRLLAKDLYKNVPEAVQLIESGHLSKWIERALGDQPGADMVTSAISRAGIGGRTAGYEDRLLCFVSMALDQRAPIRFKNMRFFPTGLGYVLCQAFATNNKDKLQNIGEVIRERYSWIWLGYKENTAEVGADKMHVFDHASKVILRRGIDFGLERCLYELCQDTPCLSDIVKNFYVNSCSNLISALDNIPAGNRSEKPIDRHIAAFISVQDNRDNAGLMLLVDSQDRMRRSLALITMFQGLQKRFENPKLLNLTEWLSKDAEIVSERFRSIPLRQDILKALPKELKTGNLTRVLNLIDNPLQVRKDENDFLVSMRHYQALGFERDYIRKDLAENANFGLVSGRQIAMFMSIISAIIMVAITIAKHYLERGH